MAFHPRPLPCWLALQDQRIEALEKRISRANYTVDASRLNFDFRTPSGVGHLRAFVEADFAAVTGSLFRQPQVRWTKEVAKRTSVALALENPNPDLTGAAGLNQVPDFVARARWEPGEKSFGPLGFLRSGAHIQAALLLRQLRGAPPDRPNDAVATGGWGFNVSGRLEVPASADRDYITFATNAGHGVGRYITDLGTLGGQDVIYDPSTNTLEALPVASAYLGYQHWWSESVRSTVTWGGVWVDNLAIQSADLNGQRGTATQYQLGGIFRF